MLGFCLRASVICCFLIPNFLHLRRTNYRHALNCIMTSIIKLHALSDAMGESPSCYIYCNSQFICAVPTYNCLLIYFQIIYLYSDCNVITTRKRHTLYPFHRKNIYFVYYFRVKVFAYFWEHIILSIHYTHISMRKRNINYKVISNCKIINRLNSFLISTIFRGEPIAYVLVKALCAQKTLIAIVFYNKAMDDCTFYWSLYLKLIKGKCFNYYFFFILLHCRIWRFSMP